MSRRVVAAQAIAIVALLACPLLVSAQSASADVNLAKADGTGGCDPGTTFDPTASSTQTKNGKQGLIGLGCTDPVSHLHGICVSQNNCRVTSTTGQSPSSQSPSDSGSVVVSPDTAGGMPASPPTDTQVPESSAPQTVTAPSGPAGSSGGTTPEANPAPPTTEPNGTLQVPSGQVDLETTGASQSIGQSTEQQNDQLQQGAPTFSQPNAQYAQAQSPSITDASAVSPDAATAQANLSKALLIQQAIVDASGNADLGTPSGNRASALQDIAATQVAAAQAQLAAANAGNPLPATPAASTPDPSTTQGQSQLVYNALADRLPGAVSAANLGAAVSPDSYLNVFNWTQDAKNAPGAIADQLQQYINNGGSPQLQAAFGTTQGLLSNSLSNSTWAQALSALQTYAGANVNQPVSSWSGLAAQVANGVLWLDGAIGSGAINSVTTLGAAVGLPGFAPNTQAAVSNAMDPSGTDFQTLGAAAYLTPFAYTGLRVGASAVASAIGDGIAGSLAGPSVLSTVEAPISSVASDFPSSLSQNVNVGSLIPDTAVPTAEQGAYQNSLASIESQIQGGNAGAAGGTPIAPVPTVVVPTPSVAPAPSTILTPQEQVFQNTLLGIQADINAGNTTLGSSAFAQTQSIESAVSNAINTPTYSNISSTINALNQAASNPENTITGAQYAALSEMKAQVNSLAQNPTASAIQQADLTQLSDSINRLLGNTTVVPEAWASSLEAPWDGTLSANAAPAFTSAPSSGLTTTDWAAGVGVTSGVLCAWLSCLDLQQQGQPSQTAANTQTAADAGNEPASVQVPVEVAQSTAANPMGANVPSTAPDQPQTAQTQEPPTPDQAKPSEEPKQTEVAQTAEPATGLQSAPPAPAPKPIDAPLPPNTETGTEPPPESKSIPGTGPLPGSPDASGVTAPQGKDVTQVQTPQLPTPAPLTPPTPPQPIPPAPPTQTAPTGSISSPDVATVSPPPSDAKPTEPTTPTTVTPPDAPPDAPPVPKPLPIPDITTIEPSQTTSGTPDGKDTTPAQGTPDATGTGAPPGITNGTGSTAASGQGAPGQGEQPAINVPSNPGDGTCPRGYSCYVGTGAGTNGYMTKQGYQSIGDPMYGGTPAARAGLTRDDVVLAVNGVNAQGWTQEQLQDALIAPEQQQNASGIGTTVTLKLQSNYGYGTVFTVTIPRAYIKSR